MKPLVMFLALLCCCAAQAQTTTSSSSSKVVITGRVIGEDGQPLAGVSVRAVSARSGAASSRPVLTNEDGVFRLTGLASTTYTLRASLPAYVATSSTGAAGQSGPYHDGDSVTIKMARGGVVTGRVINSNGEPIPGLSIKAVRLRDADGKPSSNFYFSRRADDRGVYRIFGLPAGVYVVHTDGPNAGWSWNADEQVEDAPTYHPSSSRDTATELILQNGIELSGIDIRYRGERGRRVSGKLLGVDPGFGANVYLRQPGGAENLASDYRSANMSRPGDGVGFEIRGVADGAYDLVAERRAGDDDGAASSPRRIAVRGADVSGVELRLQPFASVTGKLSLVDIKSESKAVAAPSACSGGRPAVFEEATLTLLPETAARPGANSATARSATPSRQGDFRVRHLDAGRYRFELQLPSEVWYAQAISQFNTQAKRTIDLARSGLAVKSGEKIKDVTVAIASGAASLKGTAQAAEGRKLPANLRVHLIPAEKESAEDMLRYFEIKASVDGAFAFNHVAPGKYLLMARALSDESPNELSDATPVAWDDAERLKLRRAAEALNIAVEFKPCRRIKDYDLKYTQSSR